MDNLSFGTLESPSIYSTSTKTDSSKSGTSVAKIKEKEMDFTKDNVASPIDLECNIQCERITKILNEAIYKCKLVVCLPDLVEEFNTLNSMLSSSDMGDLLFIYDQYDNPLFSASLLNMSTIEDLKAGDITLKSRLNPELAHLMYILNGYPDLKPIVYELIEQKNVTNALEFLNEMEQFRDLMVRQMETTAAEEIAEKFNQRKLEAANESYIGSIQEYSKLLAEENERFEQSMATKAKIIKKLEHELAMLSYDASVKLKKIVLDSERQMVLTTRAHLVKNEMLMEEELECKQNYDMLLHQHLLEEKHQRARKLKVETQLLSWLQKYDSEMADKQEELDEYTEKYEKVVEECEQLQKKLDEQDLRYIPLMNEREEEYHAEMTAKMEKFLLEHAARVIQFAWREVLANRAEKKKLKKLQKKMIAAAEAAAAKQEAMERAAAKAARAAAKAAARSKSGTGTK